MFGLFIISLFVPFNAIKEEYIEKTKLDVVGKDQLDGIVATKTNVVAFGFSEDAPEMKECAYQFSKKYLDDAIFVEYNETDAENAAAEIGAKLPLIFLFQNGVRVSTYPWTSNEIALAKTFELVFHGDETPIITTNEQLLRALGDMALAILVPREDLFEYAMKLHLNVSSNFGEVDVIRVVPSILQELGLRDDQLALYRNEDMTIVNLELMEEFVDSVHALFQAAKPVYRMIQMADVMDGKLQLFVFTSPSLTLEQRDFLYEMGLKYKNYTFSYLAPQFREVGKIALGFEFDDPENMYFCNFAKRWHVDITDIFTPSFLAKPFNRKQWAAKVAKVISVVEQGRPRQYLSEPVPVSSPNSLIKKVVGSTFEEFVMDPEKDVFMMFVAKGNEKCQEFKPTFINFVKEFHATGETFMKFGWIDIERNSCPMNFPTIDRLPHFELYPAKNKSDHDRVRGAKSRDSIVRFLSTRCQKPFPLHARAPNKLQTAMQLIQDISKPLSNELTDHEYQKYLQYLFEAAESIDVDLSSVPGFEEFASRLPANEAKGIAQRRILEEAENDIRKLDL